MIEKRSNIIYEYFNKKYNNVELSKNDIDHCFYLRIGGFSVNLTLALLENKNIKSNIRKINKDLKSI